MNKMTLFFDGRSVGNVSGVEARICREIAERQERGVMKYGTTLAQNDALLIERLQHAKEEALDMALYLQWAIDRLEAK